MCAVAMTCAKGDTECEAQQKSCCSIVGSGGGGVSLRRVFSAPFVIVYGSKGTAMEEKSHLQAALQLSWDWFYSSGGTTSIMSDV